MADDLEITFDLSTEPHFDALFEINTNGTVWGSIDGSIENQTDLYSILEAKQNTLIAGENITIQNNVISGVAATYTAGSGIDITNGVISNTQTSAEWGNITGTLSNQIDLQEALNAKQNTISDLSDIRSDASEGASAYGTIQTYGNIVTHNVSEFATSEQGDLANTALQPNDNITELNNNAGYITGIDSSDVITALGFTPYNSTNPDGYITSASLPTLADLTTEAQLAAINSGATTVNIGQIATNTSNISTINNKIPAQASSSNQLADKAFVNSSIASSTANFIGTFNSVADLEAYSGTLTNNDYAFVIGTDGDGNTIYNRYKYTTATNPPSWEFEYELNNSNFTASQWAAINSGVTSADVTLIGTAIQPNDNITNLTNNAGYISGVAWGDVTGTLANQTDLQNALNLKANSASLATVAISGDYDDLINKPTIPTVNNATLTIQKNGTNVETFTANASSNVTANITVPTDTNDLTNGAGFITSSALSGYATETWVGNQGYITGITSSDVTTALGYTPYNSSNPNGYTSNVGTVTSVNNVSPVSGNVTISIPTDTSDLTNGAGFITSSALGDYVTTNTEQTITADKTFSGKFNKNTSGYGAILPTTTSYTANQVLATTDQIKDVYQHYINFYADNNKTVVCITMANQSNVPFTAATFFQFLYEELPNNTTGISATGTVRISSIDHKAIGMVSKGVDNTKINIYPIVSTGGFDTVVVLNASDVVTFADIVERVGTHGGGSSSSGITDSEIIAALGYTPYSAANPASYISVNDATVANFDGQWVSSYSVFASNVTLPTVDDLSYDLSTYLPDDSYDYEVMLKGVATTAATSGANAQIYVSSDAMIYPTPICGSQTRTNSTTYACGTFILPVGTSRTVTVAKGTSNGTFTLSGMSYRRLGTNS